MKKLSEKQIATIISRVMVILLLLGYFIYPTHPILGEFLGRIAIYYAALTIFLILTYFGLVFIMRYDEIKEWLFKKMKFK